ncbi:branched-chain amino acid ABC transporter permease [Oscillospiraceae bacterium MB08-C2-2]|nr:branched-chain amino acid ABC transporter permease [Oscillospiraceae bacterium MB08-C2-2]
MALFQAAISGIFIGGVYAIIAVGLSLIFGVMKLVNFAHGDFLMAAMYAAYGVVTGWAMDPYLSMFIIAPVFFIVGFLFQRLFINGILKRERNTESPNVRLFTIGFAWFLSNLSLMLFGANPKNVMTPYTGETFKLGELSISKPRLYAFVIAIVCCILLYLLLYKTEMGRALRAISQNRFTATLMGINVKRLYCVAFGIGISIVAIAACILIPFYYVFPTLSATFGTKSFIIVVMGGLGSVPGAMLAGLLVGVVEAVFGYILGPTTADMLVFIIFVLVMLLKPSGMLGKRNRV